jgi:hypothetical protein
MRSLRARAVVVLLVAAATRLVGCGSTIAASDYDQTCTVASDCVAVGVGDPCGTPCETFPSTDVISRTSFQRYRQDAVTSQESCSHCGGIQGCAGGGQATTSAYCVNMKCTLCASANPCDCAKGDPSCTDAGPDASGGDGGGGDAGGGDAATDGGGGDAAGDAAEDGAQGDAAEDGGADAQDGASD